MQFSLEKKYIIDYHLYTYALVSKSFEIPLTAYLSLSWVGWKAMKSSLFGLCALHHLHDIFSSTFLNIMQKIHILTDETTNNIQTMKNNNICPYDGSNDIRETSIAVSGIILSIRTVTCM